MENEVLVECPFCYQSFTSLVDISGGTHQTLDIDCEVCCHALTLQVTWDEELGQATATTEKAF